MTKQEMTGRRPSWFSSWARERLPDSKTGYNITDIDFVLSDGKNLLVIEEKVGASEVTPAQRSIYRLVNTAFRDLCTKIGMKYHGVHLLQIKDEKLFWDYREIEEDELACLLSFGKMHKHGFEDKEWYKQMVAASTVEDFDKWAKANPIK